MAEHRKRSSKNVRGPGRLPGKDVIVAFRLEGGDVESLDDRVDKLKISTVESRGDMARKVLLDFLHGHLIYISPDRLVSDPVVTRRQSRLAVS